MTESEYISNFVETIGYRMAVSDKVIEFGGKHPLIIKYMMDIESMRLIQIKINEYHKWQ